MSFCRTSLSSDPPSLGNCARTLWAAVEARPVLIFITVLQPKLSEPVGTLPWIRKAVVCDGPPRPGSALPIRTKLFCYASEQNTDCGESLLPINDTVNPHRLGSL